MYPFSAISCYYMQSFINGTKTGWITEIPSAKIAMTIAALLYLHSFVTSLLICKLLVSLMAAIISALVFLHLVSQLCVKFKASNQWDFFFKSKHRQEGDQPTCRRYSSNPTNGVAGHVRRGTGKRPRLSNRGRYGDGPRHWRWRGWWKHSCRDETGNVFHRTGAVADARVAFDLRVREKMLK